MVNIKDTKRQVKGKKTKQKILNCALQLFKENGYYNVSVDEIVAKAKSSKGAFYNYFTSKDELVTYHMGVEWDPLYAKYYEEILMGTEYASKNALEKFKDMFIYILNILSFNGAEFARVASAYILKDSRVSLIMTDPQRKYYKIMLALIQNGKDEDVINDDLSNDIIVRGITVLIRGLISDWGINNGNYNLTETGSLMFDMFCAKISKQKL